MSFMSLFVTREDFVMFEDREGGQAIPLDVITEVSDPPIDALTEEIERTYSFGGVRDVQIVRGKWWSRYSAPGYLDCTDWVGPCDTEAQAIEECKELYGDDEDE
jgi:hypothetical protein